MHSFILLLVKAAISSINTSDPVPLAAKHAHAIALPITLDRCASVGGLLLSFSILSSSQDSGTTYFMLTSKGIWCLLIILELSKNVINQWHTLSLIGGFYLAPRSHHTQLHDCNRKCVKL